MDCKIVEIKQESELIIIDDNIFNIKEIEEQPKTQLEQPIICVICKKGFRQEDFRIHVTTHTDDLTTYAFLLDQFNNLPACEDSTNCLKLLKSSTQLEQPIICKRCKKGFKKEDLPIHLTNCKGQRKIVSTNCCNFFKCETSELVKHQLTCKKRLRRIAKIQKEYLQKDWNLILRKTSLLCVICKDTLYETNCDDHILHCLSCGPPRRKNLSKPKHSK